MDLTINTKEHSFKVYFFGVHRHITVLPALVDNDSSPNLIFLISYYKVSLDCAARLAKCYEAKSKNMKTS